MKAAIVIIGSELLTPFKQDTNSLYITDVLNSTGIQVSTKVTIGDNEEELADLLITLATNHELLILSGGLGPTRDDITREAVAQFAGVPLLQIPELLKDISVFFSERGRELSDTALRQSYIPEGSHPLSNPLGTAPGFRLDSGNVTIWSFPGVPQELKIMVEEHLLPCLKSFALPSLHLLRISLSGKPEPECETLLKPYYEQYGREGFSILSGGGKIEFICSSDDSNLLKEKRRLLTSLFSDDIFSFEGEPIEKVMINLLTDKCQTLSVAESCTGGLLAKRLTDIAGASRVFKGGVVAYDNEVKIHVLGLPVKLIENSGAVSEAVARTMAEDIRSLFKTDYGIGITGVAGPSGGSALKPVGTVHIAVAGKEETCHSEFHFPKGRSRIRSFASQLALDMLRRMFG